MNVPKEIEKVKGWKCMYRIHCIEDDALLADCLIGHLEQKGYEVHWSPTLTQAKTRFQSTEFHCVILDLKLPDGMGLSMCEYLRTRGVKTPIVVLTAETDEDLLVDCLNAGANDYVRKPYKEKELLARVGVMLRDQTEQQIIELGGLRLDINQRALNFRGNTIALNRREFDILQLFLRRPDTVITRELIIDKLDSSEELLDRTIDSHVSHIRKKFRDAGINTVQIKSEYGLGYRLKAS